MKYGRHTLAANELSKALHVVKTNSPINKKEGNVRQAGLEDKTATSIKGALKTLAEDKMKEIGRAGVQSHGGTYDSRTKRTTKV